MDSDALATFIAIHQAGGFSRAAEVLNRTQPAISRRIALLEQELEVALFERISGGVVLSQAGRVLLPHAERVVAALKDARDAVGELATERGGPLSVATVGTLASTSLTAVLKEFVSQFPLASLSLRTATSDEVSDLVRRGEVTIGIRYQKDVSPELICHELRSESLVVACAVEHALAGERVPALGDLSDQHWLAFPKFNERREASAENVFAQFQIRGVPSIGWSPVDSLTAQKRLIEAGFGVGLLPESSVVEERAAGTLSIIGVGDLDAHNPVYAVVRRGGYLSAAALGLLEQLKDPGQFSP